MRPLLVLSLVIVAVATLLFVLFSLSGDEPDSGAVTAVGTEVLEPEPTPDSGNVRPVSRGSATSPADDGGERQVATNTRDEVQGKLTFENALTGRITDPEGVAMAGVDLTLTSGAAPGGNPGLQQLLGGEQPERRVRKTATGSDGSYRFRNLEPGGYALRAEHPDFSRHEEPFVMISHSDETLLDIQLQEGLIVAGRVRDEAGGLVSGAKVELSAASLTALWAPQPKQALEDDLLVTETNGEGYYQFTNVTPGSLHLTAHADGYGRATKRNMRLDRKNGTHQIDFVLTEGKTIAGRVFAPDRTAIVGATVKVIGYQPPQTLESSTVTDQRGRFSIPDLVEGPYLLTVMADGWGIERRQRIEAPDTKVEIEMTEQGSIMGRVVMTDGDSPVTSFVATLHQYIEQSASYGRAMRQDKFETDDGTFVLKGVTEGRYAIRIEAGGFAPSYSSDFTVTQGLVTTDVLVVLGRGGGIRGIVYDAASGEPVSRATVITRDNDYRENFLTKMFGGAMPEHATNKKVITDANGEFEVDLLTPDVYQVVVTHPRYPEKRVQNIRVLEGDVTDADRIGLEKGGVIRGVVYDRAGEPLIGASVQLVTNMPGEPVSELRTQSGPDGRYKLDNIPAGTYNLMASRPSSKESPFITIVDVKNSQVAVTISIGEELSEDLFLGGDS